MGVIELAVVLLLVILVAIIMIMVGNKKQGKSSRGTANINQREKSRHNNTQYGVANQQSSSVSSKQGKVDLYSTLQYYVIVDKKNYGPLSLEQLKAYPLQEDTLVSTNTLGNKWYEAKYFECLDNLFGHDLPFRIDEDGVIIRGEGR